MARCRCAVDNGSLPSGFFSGRGNNINSSAGVSGNAALTLACWARMIPASRSWTGRRQPTLPTLGMSCTSTGLARRRPSLSTYSSKSRQENASVHNSAVRRPTPAPSSTAAVTVDPNRFSSRSRFSGDSSWRITTSGRARPTSSSLRRVRGRSTRRITTSSPRAARAPPGLVKPISRQSRRNRSTPLMLLARISADSTPVCCR